MAYLLLVEAHHATMRFDARRREQPPVRGLGQPHYRSLTFSIHLMLFTLTLYENRMVVVLTTSEGVLRSVAVRPVSAPDCCNTDCRELDAA